MDKKYSNWLKIDLHIHTDWSKKTKENDYKGIFSVTTLKKQLISNGVQIFSLTDHNIINIDAYKEYYENCNTDADPLLLIGIELDILVENNSTEKTYHSLLIFNNPNIEYATELCQRLEKKYSELDLTDKQRKLTIDEVVNLFPEDDFFFIPHAGNTKSIIDSYKGNIAEAQKMVLLMQSAFEKVPEKARQKYNDGFNKVLEEKFRNKDDNAYIEFSDNHNIEKYPCANKGDDDRIHSFYSVKGGKNFETLRLAFIDPKSRIKSHSQINDINTTSNYLEAIKFEGDVLLNDSEVSFSPHLNVLIGGRSSGKSLMMSILGDKIDSITVDKNKYKIDYSKVQVKTKLDSSFQSAASIQKDEIIYIEQGQIVRYFEEKKLIDLAKEANKSEEYEEAKRQFGEHRKKLETLIETFQSSFQKCMEISTKRFVLHSATMESILNNNFIFIFDSPSVLRKYDNSTLIVNGKEVTQRLSEDIIEFRDNATIDFEESELTLIENLIQLIESKKTTIKKKEDSNTKKLTFVQNVSALVIEKNNELNSEAKQKQVSKRLLQTLLNDIKSKFTNCSELKSNSDTLDSFDYSFTQEIDVNDVKLILEVERESSETTKSLILDGINNCSSDENLYINFLGILNKSKTIKNHETTAENLNKKIIRQLSNIFEKLNNPKDFLKYNDGETSKSNSPGYNSEKYLELILCNPKSKVIFIDQPEDNLGNRFISENLVEMIRKIKFQKQIFLVTHNPSIVVYGDAENIIIATNDGNKIDYKQVVLENKNSQIDICHILDGGQYIFDMRAKKYNIKRILTESANG
jgi:hypothetical protein